MDNALLVRRFERVGNLPRDRKRLVERQWTLRNAIGERRTFNRLESQRLDGPAKAGHYGCLFFEPVNRRDVGMIQRIALLDWLARRRDRHAPDRAA